jgi:hypothetical protein
MSKMKESKANPNMALWDSVFTTDPSQTKEFTRGGGFRGTSIKPYWLIMRATEIFGPIGQGWGWNVHQTEFTEHGVFALVSVWYRHGPAPADANVLAAGVNVSGPQWGGTLWRDSPKRNMHDDEAPKKSVTDAISKCLSYIGFAGDIHMGMFDDSKYVSELKAEERKKKAEAEGYTEEQCDEILEETTARLMDIENVKALRDFWVTLGETFERLKATDYGQEINKTIVKRFGDRKVEIVTLSATDGA